TTYGKASTPELSFTYSAHSQTISGLTSGTLYHYRLRSQDAAGNLAISTDATFTTAGSAPVTTPPTGSAVIAGSSYPVSGTNVARDAEALVVYTQAGTQVVSPANEWGAEAAVVNGVITEFRDRQGTGFAAMPIPAGGYVLSGNGAARTWLLANALVGRTVTSGAGGGATTTPTPTPTTGNLPNKVVGGYLTTWENRNNASLRWIVDNTNYNLIYVAFATGVNATSGTLTLDLPPGASSPADFKSQVAYANSKGKKVILSVGGYFDLTGQQIGYRLDQSYKIDQLMASMRTYRNEWGFNGMDWDLEQGERPYDKNGIVDASQRMRSEFGSDFIICFAPGPNLATWVGAGGVLDTLGPGGWDAVGEQLYDLNVSESEHQTQVINRMAALTDKYGASKVLLGNKYRQDNPNMAYEPNMVIDISTTKAALATLRASGRNIRGSFVWTIQSDGDQGYAWQGSSGVGGDILAHP
ncbi:MAG: hypothetical protein H7123_08485, partial [Thermoleophilia bacterium]|nr:hypothetical protein [Thermoleophilia bacterium]